jgi:hypothetical protein
MTPLPQPLGLKASFGFGDRSGLATTGHIASMREAGSGIAAIFAQQSIREMTRTQRTPRNVMDDALNAMKAANWTEISGADADHLKTPADVDVTAAVGFCFFTIDPSGDVDGKCDDYSVSELEEKFNAVQSQIDWIEQYRGKTIKLSNGSSIVFTEEAIKRCAVKYGKAIEHAVSLAKYIEQVNTKAGKPFEIELSVDETPQPTTSAEHYIIADQCRKKGMRNLVSLAPRFVGEFEKGVDFKGSLSAFEKSLSDHAAIARDVGPYKLSLHSGSDKLSIYPAFARHTKGMFHVKTAGTSYLEAIRAVAHLDNKLFREIVDFSRTRYDTDKATYHVSATNDSVPPGSDIRDDRELEQIYLGLWEKTPSGKGMSDPGRQILHCTFGSVLTNEKYKALIQQILRENQKVYTELLRVHFAKHLVALKAGL